MGRPHHRNYRLLPFLIHDVLARIWTKRTIFHMCHMVSTFLKDWLTFVGNSMGASRQNRHIAWSIKQYLMNWRLHRQLLASWLVHCRRRRTSLMSRSWRFLVPMRLPASFSTSAMFVFADNAPTNLPATVCV